MDREYWLTRKRASLTAAQNAFGAEARLVHYDLAGRYSVKAASDETRVPDALSPAIDASHSLDFGGARFDV